MSEETAQHYEGKHAEVRRKTVWSPLARLALYNFRVHMTRMMAEVRGSYDEDAVLASREGRELVRNDGSTTYVVHSTTPEDAKDIISSGLRLRGKHGKPEVPNLARTGIMLAGRDEKAATERNIHSLAYRYGGVEDSEYSSIKLVYAFDQPNPGTSQNDDPFANTFLERPDGVNIQQLSAEGRGQYLIPPERLKGYFDLGSGQFVANPHFAQQPSVGHGTGQSNIPKGA